MFRKLLQVSLACLALGGASGCASSLTKDIETQAVADPKVDFSGMKSFGWLGAATELYDPEGLWTQPSFDIASELKSLIDAELGSRGYEESREPDLAVAMMVVADVSQLEKIEAERGGALPDLVGVGKGAIVLELIDTETGKTVWIGAAAGEVRTNRSEEETKERLAYVVKQLFRQLPK